MSGVCSGTMVILEENYVLELKELHLCPKGRWRPKSTVPSPEPFTESKARSHSQRVGLLAPDDSAILLQYQLQDEEDACAAWADDANFDVGDADCSQLMSGHLPHICRALFHHAAVHADRIRLAWARGVAALRLSCRCAAGGVPAGAEQSQVHLDHNIR